MCPGPGAPKPCVPSKMPSTAKIVRASVHQGNCRNAGRFTQPLPWLELQPFILALIGVLDQTRVVDMAGHWSEDVLWHHVQVPSGGDNDRNLHEWTHLGRPHFHACRQVGFDQIVFPCASSLEVEFARSVRMHDYASRCKPTMFLISEKSNEYVQ